MPVDLEIAEQVAQALVDDGAEWFIRLCPFDSMGKLEIPIARNGETYYTEHFLSTGTTPCLHLRRIMEVKARLAARPNPNSPIASTLTSFVNELSKLPDTDEIAIVSIMRRSYQLLAAVYFHLATRRILCVLRPPV